MGLHQDFETLSPKKLSMLMCYTFDLNDKHSDFKKQACMKSDVAGHIKIFK